MDRTYASDDYEAESRQLAEDDAYERFFDLHGHYPDDETEDWAESALTVGDRNR